MIRLLFLLIVIWSASAARAQTAATSVEAQVSEALAADIRARMGASAHVSVGEVHLSVRGTATGPLAVVPSPGARLGQPVEFVLLGAGAGGRAAQVGRGRADVTVLVPHARTLRTMARGTVVASGDMSDSTGEPGPVAISRLPTAHELVGATLRRDVVGGEVLTLRSAALPPAVRAGDPVHATATIGGVQVTAQLTAVDNGAQGSVVRVVNRDTRREVRARVVRAGVVEVIHE